MPLPERFTVPTFQQLRDEAPGNIPTGRYWPFPATPLPSKPRLTKPDDGQVFGDRAEAERVSRELLRHEWQVVAKAMKRQRRDATDITVLKQPKWNRFDKLRGMAHGNPKKTARLLEGTRFIKSYPEDHAEGAWITHTYSKQLGAHARKGPITEPYRVTTGYRTEGKNGRRAASTPYAFTALGEGGALYHIAENTLTADAVNYGYEGHAHTLDDMYTNPDRYPIAVSTGLRRAFAHLVEIHGIDVDVAQNPDPPVAVAL